MVLIIQNATLLTPFERVGPTDVAIDGGRIREIGKGLHVPGSQRLEASGLLLVPGFVELQINGAFGMDFTSDPASIWPVAARLPCYGVTSFLPTIVTSPLETIAAAQSVALGGMPAGFRGAVPLGLHVEGPFLNPERKGAHRAEYLRPPSLQEYAGVSRAQGVRLVTLAPELPGALPVIVELVGRGVVVSAGHSMATLQQARRAFAGGVSYGTHLFNAMAPLHQFEPGLPGALLAEPGMRFGLIPDGIHVHPTLVDLVWKLSGPGRMTLVTDAMAALGMPPGVYQLGEKQAVYVDDTSARLSNGNLAGSILPHDAALRNLMAFTGCSLGEALTCLTSTPAALLGLADEIGQVAPGQQANLVLLMPDLHVAKTLVAGEIVYDRAAIQAA
jgi:N-acetylglucosamine-6-phosphate deacetylase